MANLKNTSINDTGFFKLPSGDTAARPASPAATQLRFNTDTGQLEQFRPGLGNWIAPSNTGVIGTGGDAVYDVDTEGTTYRVHVFTATGTSTFEVFQGGEVEYLIVAGGGGGGTSDNGSSLAGGGGGAGGMLAGYVDLSAQTYSVAVGSGGAEQDGPYTGGNFGLTNNPGAAGNSGNDSTAFGFTAIGGGGGATRNAHEQGLDGGSGGGAAGVRDGVGGSGTSGQGNSGGAQGEAEWGAAGGGGAGKSAEDCPSGRTNTPGGTGLSSFITGTSVFYAGGGGGGGHNPTGGAISNGASGGLGGGARGGDHSVDQGQDATPNTGGGGGGGPGFNNNSQSNSDGGAGGDGIVVIRYPLRQNNPETAAGQDVGNGLVLDLDFAKPTVYSGSRSVVTDSRLGPGSGNIQGSFVYVNDRTHRSAFEFDYSSVFIPLSGLENFDFVEGITVNFWHFNGGGTGSYRGVATNGVAGERQGGFDMRYGRENYFGGDNNGTGLGWRIRTPNSDQDELRMNAPVGEWHMYTGTYDNSVQRVYVDGGFFDSNTHSTGGQLKTMPGDITIGRSPGTSEYLDGTLALVEIYSRPLSEEELTKKFEYTRWRFGV